MKRQLKRQSSAIVRDGERHASKDVSLSLGLEYLSATVPSVAIEPLCYNNVSTPLSTLLNAGRVDHYVTQPERNFAYRRQSHESHLATLQSWIWTTC